MLQFAFQYSSKHFLLSASVATRAGPARVDAQENDMWTNGRGEASIREMGERIKDQDKNSAPAYLGRSTKKVILTGRKLF